MLNEKEEKVKSRLQQDKSCFRYHKKKERGLTIPLYKKTIITSVLVKTPWITIMIAGMNYFNKYSIFIR